MISVENWNETFPDYPKTVKDKGWIYGVWYCSTLLQRNKLHGQYPKGFVKRAMALFPTAERVLHAPSGTIEGHGITMDAVVDEVRKPMVQANAASLPFKSGYFDLVLSDPPYSAEDSKKYGMPPFPMNRFMAECYRVLKPGGYFGMLHVYYPSWSKSKGWRMVAMIAVVTGFCKRTRMFSIFEKTRQGRLFE